MLNPVSLSLCCPACHTFLHLRSTFRCAHPSLCPLCYPTQRFGLEDGVSRRWCFLKTVSMLGWCTPGQLPEGMETLLCCNSDVILCLDPLVIFVICNRFCIKHCNVSLLLSHVWINRSWHTCDVRSVVFSKPGVTKEHLAYHYYRNGYHCWVHHWQLISMSTIYSQ